jgi:MoaA/NifB/PqqE/SkfB family radical SAM enzyme
MTLKRKYQINTDDQGNIVVPPIIAQKFGLRPGIDLLLEEADDEMIFRRPVSHLAKVYIEPTSKCNLSCKTCIRNVWEEKMGRMTSATFTRILKGIGEFDHRPSIFLGGFGEPLSHPHIVDMVAQAKQVSSKVELITNGMLLNEKISVGLIDAGLDTLWVSVDGAKPESYADVRIGAALPEIFENIKQYRHQYILRKWVDPDIGLAFVAMKRNIGDLPLLLKMSTKLGISHYMVTNVLPYTKEMRDEMLYDRSVETLVSKPMSWAPGLDLPIIDANQYTIDPLIQVMGIRPRNYLAYRKWSDSIDYCPFIRKGSIAIAWDGNVSPCLPLMHQHESYLKEWKRTVKRHVVGNVKDQSLKTIWGLPEYMDFRKRVDEFDFSPCTICASCEMAESNLEDCYGNSFPTCGGCLWAQGFIRCP